jgi:hypothetical protein
MLKDNLKSETLDEIWQKQILVASYDELWRKLCGICGPFIEILNPGFLAEESRLYRHGASSIVQLMHQSVRDFLCDPGAAGALYFSLEEARELARCHLERYLNLTISDCLRITTDGPQEPQLVGDWLNDQKILQLAIEAAEERRRSELRSLRRNLDLKPPPKGSSECLLVSAIHEKAYPQGCGAGKAELILAIGRLLYNAYTEGLVTAVRNILALRWITADDVGSSGGEIITSCIIFVASRCGSTKVKVELELRADQRLETSGPVPRNDGSPVATVQRSGYAPAVPSLLRQCISITDLVTDINWPLTLGGQDARHEIIHHDAKGSQLQISQSDSPGFQISALTTRNPMENVYKKHEEKDSRPNPIGEGAFNAMFGQNSQANTTKTTKTEFKAMVKSCLVVGKISVNDVRLYGI